MLIPIILSGGVGSRLWPLSRKDKPKHFMPLIDDHISKNNSDINKSLLQQTILRCNNELFSTSPVMVCDNDHRFLVENQCLELNIKPEGILLEPERKDTAAAILLSVLYIHSQYSDAVVLISPSDHYMPDNKYYLNRVSSALEHANNNKIVTFGITPSYPETGYGYINADLNKSLINNSFEVKRFLEKPDLETAIQLLDAKDCFWNSGMFMFKAEKLIELCKELQPDLYNYCLQTLKTANNNNSFVSFDNDNFRKINPISIDYAIMQDAKDMVVVQYDGQWTDVGCWHGVWRSSPKDKQDNVVMGNVLHNKTNNCYLRSDSRLVVALGIDNITVIETPDAVLVSGIEDSQNLRNLVESQMSTKRKEFIEHSHVHRPWGEYIILSDDSSNYKVKKLLIKPGASLSLQSHKKRDEHWVVVQGSAEVVKEDKTLSLNLNDTVFIPVGTKHRITNTHATETLVIIEVQVGDYLGEDDIIRYHDLYGRVK